ncbi:MAG: CDP-glycerol glycerophosphotransferase family protein, partial [Alphaproteobacteria bacterium]
AAANGRVAIHVNKRFHFPFLKPLFDLLAREHEAIVTSDAKRIADFDPDVVIVADAQAGELRSHAPRAVFVFTRHGLISKNISVESVRLSDYVCVTSEASRDWYVERGALPRKGFWITGYVQMDPLFRRDAAPIPFAPTPGRKVVLYAPTFNPALSSAPMLGARVAELIRGGREIELIIKPHPMTVERQPSWMAGWRAAAARHSDVHLVEDPAADLVPYLQAADVLVTDVSSAMFQFLALERPIVLVTNPMARSDPERFDPEGPEWAWRDVGEEVHDVGSLAAAVARALDDPGRGAERRAHYRRLLFGDLTDGRAAERIALNVTRLLRERASP